MSIAIGDDLIVIGILGVLEFGLLLLAVRHLRGSMISRESSGIARLEPRTPPRHRSVGQDRAGDALGLDCGSSDGRALAVYGSRLEERTSRFEARRRSFAPRPDDLFRGHLKRLAGYLVAVRSRNYRRGYMGRDYHVTGEHEAEAKAAERARKPNRVGLFILRLLGGRSPGSTSTRAQVTARRRNV